MTLRRFIESAKKKDIQAVQQGLFARLDVNGFHEGRTALHAACMVQDNDKVIAALLTAKAHVNLPTTNGSKCTALYFATVNNAGLSVVKRLVEEKSDVCVVEKARGLTLLHCVGQRTANPAVWPNVLSRIEVASYLLDHGAQKCLFTLDNNNVTPLQTTIAELAEFYRSWAPSQRSNPMPPPPPPHPLPPLQTPAIGKPNKPAEIIIQPDDNGDCCPTAKEFVIAAGEKNIDYVTRAIQWRIDINIKHKAKTALLMACSVKNNEAVVSVLLDAKADVHISTEMNSYTALFYAVWYNTGLEAVRRLVKEGADVCAKSKGLTVLHCLSLRDGDVWTGGCEQRIAVAKFLLENGAHPCLSVKSGQKARTPMETAEHYKRQRLASFYRNWHTIPQQNQSSRRTLQTQLSQIENDFKLQSALLSVLQNQFDIERENHQRTKTDLESELKTLRQRFGEEVQAHVGTKTSCAARIDQLQEQHENENKDHEAELHAVRQRAERFELQFRLADMCLSLCPVPFLSHEEFEKKFVYKTVRPFAGGGFGDVFRGTFNKEDVAYKQLRYDEEYARKCMEAEARVLLSVHDPAVVRLRAVVTKMHRDKPEVFGLVLEYIEGFPLNKYLTATSLTLSDRMAMTKEIVGIMMRLHHSTNKPLVHRDFKPSNIMIRPNNSLVLIDFGLSRIEQSQGGVMTDHVMAGTQEYLAPEQYDAKGHITHKVDVYAFGVMLPQLMCGQFWHLEASQKRGQNPLPPFPKFEPSSLCKAVSDLATWCVALHRDDRPDFEQVQEQLTQIFKKNEKTTKPKIKVWGQR